MLEIDGSTGEGGGQILRTSLSASLCLQQPFRIVGIRRRRERPGLRAQHLAAVNAAARLSAARVDGAVLGSTSLEFEPGPVRAGGYRFDIGTAGSTTLVAQTLLPALLTADAASELHIVGGTHNPRAPPFEFLQRVFLPTLARMGGDCRATLLRAGFYPAGGGEIQVSVQPTGGLTALRLIQRGELLERCGRALLARLPDHVGRRELAVLGRELGWPEHELAIERVDSAGPGNMVYAWLRCRSALELFSTFGRRGLPAERVASALVEQVRGWLAADVPVGRYLADQLLLPIGLAGGGVFRTVEPSSHTRTNMAVLSHWLGRSFDCERLDELRWEVRFPSASAAARPRHETAG